MPASVPHRLFYSGIVFFGVTPPGGVSFPHSCQHGSIPCPTWKINTARLLAGFHQWKALPHEVGRLADITLSLTYGVAFVGPFIGGALWDLFDVPALAFMLIVVASIMLMILGALLPSRSSFAIQTAIRSASK